MDSGFFYKHLKEWYNLFPKKNILVLFDKDIKNNELEFMGKIYEFLGVSKHSVPKNLKLKVNTAKRAPNNWKSDFDEKDRYFICQDSLFGPKRHFSKLMRNSKIVKIYDFLIINFVYKNSMKPKLNPETENKLKKLHYSDVEKLGKLLNRDLISEWGFK